VRHNFQVSAYWELPLFRGRHDFLGASPAADAWGNSGQAFLVSRFLLSLVAANTSADRNGDSYCPGLALWLQRRRDFRSEQAAMGKRNLPQSNEHFAG